MNNRKNNLADGRRNMLRTLALGSMAVTAGAALGPMAQAAQAPTDSRVRAVKLYTGKDNASHVLTGSINQQDRTDVDAIHFKETAAHSAFAWHNDPEPQYVITLSGTLEFTTRDGEKFLLHPGDVLIAEDNIGTGHRWRLVDDQPWRRAYVVLKPGAKDSFVPDAKV